MSLLRMAGPLGLPSSPNATPGAIAAATFPFSPARRGAPVPVAPVAAPPRPRRASRPPRAPAAPPRVAAPPTVAATFAADGEDAFSLSSAGAVTAGASSARFFRSTSVISCALPAPKMEDDVAEASAAAGTVRGASTSFLRSVGAATAGSAATTGATAGAGAAAGGGLLSSRGRGPSSVRGPRRSSLSRRK